MQKGTIQVATDSRVDGVYLIIRPGPELRQRGWYDLEKGPYETEEAAQADAQRVVDTLVEALPSGRARKM